MGFGTWGGEVLPEEAPQLRTRDRPLFTPIQAGRLLAGELLRDTGPMSVPGLWKMVKKPLAAPPYRSYTGNTNIPSGT